MLDFIDWEKTSDNMVALLIRFLEQNNGKLSQRALEKEFVMLTADEVTDIEKRFNDLFSGG